MIEESIPTSPWMIMRVARTINRYRVGKDGKTAYRISKGKDFRRTIAEFWGQVASLKPRTMGIDKLACRWEKGVWLGVLDESGEAFIGADRGIVKCRDIKRLSDIADRWCAAAVKTVTGTPWEFVPGRRGIYVLVNIREEDGPQGPPPPV